ncbi:succinate dehydrogenase cytochrome b560 subunit, mitochondrial-like isoform X2 [Ruditapes philippinarum]|uniref:succinate dehydrogenase cytochrome b560 subunit, mitochondrial-like isoform X2 n=1 Tax=Ruditapes philippinarum TaxID=129788 RepID=UPI00295AE8BF|nr:succinate dehydrogenase cytochrome b560 subunit, mitochondrial-like isoform X2 [Ruditapes philippinarum]
MAGSMRLNTVPRLLQASKCFQSCIIPASSQTKAADQMEKYWKKNRDRNRPLSPHLTIYKLPVTAVMSISNRITGTILTAVIYGGPIIYLLGSNDFAGYLQMVQSWGPVGTGLINLTKFTLAFSFSYHTIASIRHLAWDMVMGFQLPQIVKTGWAVLFFTLLMTAALMAL